MTENETALESLRRNVAECQDALDSAVADLKEFERAPERNVFDSLADANELEDTLLDRAAADCGGSYNVGLDEYSQCFYVGDKLYVAILEVEYNRHDKTYYYVDGHDFRIEEA